MPSETWYAHPNDLIGGWAVMSVDRPPSTLAPEDEGREVAIFTCEEDARRIADLNNADLAGRLLPDGGETRTDEEWTMSYKLDGEQQPPGHGGHVFDSRKEAERHISAWRDCYPSLAYTDVRYLSRRAVTGPWVEVTDAAG